MNKSIIILIQLLLLPLLVSAQDIVGSGWEWDTPEPFKEYTYGLRFALAVGGLSTRESLNLEDVTWVVTNGKIKDRNGNYTLTSLTKLADELPDGGVTISTISIMWDNEEEGKIEFYMPLNYYICGFDGYTRPIVFTTKIKPFNGNVTNIHINNERVYNTQNIYVKDVVIENGANVILNGYNSVRIVPGFIAESGSTLRIYNGAAPKVQTKSVLNDESILENEIGIDKYSAKLYQNIPNPASFVASIPLVIPEIRKSAYLQFYNMMGVLVMKIPITSIGQNCIDVNTAELTDGVYMYSLVVDDCLIDTKRMVVAN